MWPWERTVAPDELVRVEVPGLGALRARVVRAVPGAAELLVLRPRDGAPGAPDLPPRFLHGRACAVTLGEATGGERIDGRLVAVRTPAGGLDRELLHFVLGVPRAPTAGLAGAAAYAAAASASPPPFRAVHPQPAAAQRRTFHRVPVERPITLVPERFRVGWLDGRTLDLSAGGALVRGAERLREGDRMRVLLELAPDRIIDTSGRIVRIDDRGLAGVALHGLTAQEREGLARYVALRQQLALAELRETS